MKISKKGEPEKKFGIEETERGKFQNEREDQTFQDEFRDRKG